MFSSLCVQTDVTCVEIFDNYIAAGVGGFLHIYKLPENNLVKKEKIFEGQKIFGIKPNSQTSELIVYGGKYIALIPFQTRHIESGIIGNKQILSDWILDVKWLENDTKIVTVFMHNKITIWSENFTNQISVKCEERCILYSAHICYDNFKQLLILSGTVFSEILLWKPYYTCQNDLSPVLKRLKQHKGVIFSIHCNLNNGLICTTSDDRSAVLWKIINIEDLDDVSPANSDRLQIDVRCQVYGHQARVFRCLVHKDFFITAGEDSLLIIWDFGGSVLRKIDTHQGGAIWSLCYDSDIDVICSGGNDGAILTFQANPETSRETIYLPNAECPKIIGILKTGNIICLTESAILYHRAFTKWEEVARHNDLQQYSLLQVSPCKNMVALAGIEGQIYIYHETNGILESLHTYHLKNKTRIFSFHWIDCKTFLVSQKDGVINLCFIYEQEIHYVQKFVLPQIKERWPTCACAVNNHIIIGDRKGNIHNFKVGNEKAINSKKKSHNYLGVTNLYSNSNVIISLGKDGILRRYKLLDKYLECIDSNKTKFSWLTALERDYLLSFSGDNFVISDVKQQRVLFETQCGGGHRSWDYLKALENITFSYIKQKVIHVIKLNLEHFTPKAVIEGYHIREINCLKVLNIDGHHIIVSGGEDTILRISVLQKNNTLKVLESLKVHLSSIRAINIYPGNNTNEYLLFTAGGRTQIICWHLHVQVKNCDSLKITCTEKYNYYEPLKQDGVETRIVDLSVVDVDGQVFLFAGCSDGFIKIFLMLDSMRLKLQKTILHSHHSITKLAIITTPSIELLGSMATDGNLMFWSVPDLCHSNESNALCSFRMHQSGITSCSYILNGQNILFLSGGDDSRVILTSFVLNKDEDKFSVSKVNSCQNNGIHCAQVTGTHILDKYFVTSSIDQRIVISKWTLTETKVTFESLGKYNTSIADLQGLEATLTANNLSFCIYGNGVEHLQVKLSKDLEL